MANNRTKLPAFLKEYFWDIKFENLDFGKYEYYVTNRLLEKGDIKAVRWLFKNVKREKIIEVLLTTRDLSLLNSSFWCNYFQLDKTKMICMEKSLREMRKQLWPY